MRKCRLCGFEAEDHLFSRKHMYREFPNQQITDVCRTCATRDEKAKLAQDVSNRWEMRRFEKKEIARQKKRIREGVSTSAVIYAAKKAGLLVDPKVLEKARKDAQTYSQKKSADAALRKLFKARIKALKTVDEEDLPEHLMLNPEQLEYLLETNQKSEKAQRDRMLASGKKSKLRANLDMDSRRISMDESAAAGVQAHISHKDIVKNGDVLSEPGSSPVEKELASRVLARRKLLHFIQRMKPDYDAGWVHHDICRRLERFIEDVEAGKGPRLMLFMPPRHGKSLIASGMFPPWVLGRFPDWEFIAASYGVTLPLEFSRNIRDLMKDEGYQKLFPRVNLRPDSQSAERWVTKQGGGYVAAGVGSGITGKGADVFIIDDPIKDAAEADSETVREGAWNWWSSTASTRLSPKSGVLVIQTRWHDDDLAGRMVTQMKELIKEGAPTEEIDNWEIIEYPALATENEWLSKDGQILRQENADSVEDYLLRRKDEALHPSRYDEVALRRKKRTMQPRHWSAMYQQNPMPDEGEYFKKDMFRFCGSLPPLAQMKVFAAFDLAIGEKQQNDYTVGVVGGLDYNDQLYVFDLIRFKGDSFKIVEAILSVYEKYRPELIGIEKGQLELAIKPILKKRMREKRLYPTLAEGDKALVPITDKLARARPLQGRMQQGMVYLLNTQPWVETAEYELLRFPGGVNDDIVDALAWLTRLAMMSDPPPKPTGKLAEKSWRARLGQYVNEGGSSGPMAA